MEKNKADKFKSRPDGWAQFERAVDAAVKSGPKHKSGKPPPTAKAAIPARRAPARGTPS